MIIIQRSSVIVTLFILLMTNMLTHGSESQLIDETVTAISLKNSLFKLPLEQKIVVYIPPSYQTSQKKYSVVYFLTGFNTPIHYFTSWCVLQGFHLKESMDRLIADGKIQEMIVVIPNVHTFQVGSFYTDSSVNGNWENYIVHDLVSFIDNTFRTKQTQKVRGIADHSMWGFGALQIGMKFPDKFGMIYALNPGVFGPDGLKQHTMFVEEEMIHNFIDKAELFDSMKKDEAQISYMSFITNLVLCNDISNVFSYAYGSAFAPNPQKSPPYIDYPFTRTDDGLMLDNINWSKFEFGFGGLER